MAADPRLSLYSNPQGEDHRFLHATAPSAPPATGGESYIVYGIPISDSISADLARKVMNISSAMALCALISSIIQLVAGSYYQIGIFAAVLIPCCGYCGALRRSKLMLCFFTFSNLVLAILFMISFIVSTSVTGDYVSCACNPACRAKHDIPFDEAQSICGNPGKFRVLYWVSMAFAFVMFGLQLWGFYFGYRLMRTKHMMVQSHIPLAQPIVGMYP